MILSYKYRLYPNKEQTIKLKNALYWHCNLYNAALEERIGAYEKNRTSIKYNSQSSQLKEIRNDNKDLSSLSFTSLQQTLRKLDKAYQSFFNRIKKGEKPGFPRYKSLKRFKSFISVIGDGAQLKHNKLYVKGIGVLKVNLHRPIPTSAVLKQVVIKEHNNKWYATFQLEISSQVQEHVNQEVIGIDLGVDSFAVLSDGTKIENPRYYRKSEQKLKRLNRSLSRKKKGSKRFKKQVSILRKHYEHTVNQKIDFQHKLSNQLCNDYSFIALENLSITDMLDGYLNKSINDVAWNRFVQMLEYKSLRTGTNLVKIDPSYTSQICSGCGNIIKKSLNQRIHACSRCGLILDRDHNAAINILRLGLSLQALTQTSRLNVA